MQFFAQPYPSPMSRDQTIFARQCPTSFGFLLMGVGSGSIGPRITWKISADFGGDLTVVLVATTAVLAVMKHRQSLAQTVGAVEANLHSFLYQTHGGQYLLICLYFCLGKGQDASPRPSSLCTSARTICGGCVTPDMIRILPVSVEEMVLRS